MLAAPLSANDFCLYANASHIKAMISAKIISSMLCFPQFLKIPTFFTHNAASMRGYEMEAEPQCSRRRRAWLGYVAGSICTAPRASTSTL